MSPAARSLAVFAAYPAAMGVGFLLAPNRSLGLFGFEPTSEPWVRVLAVLGLLLGYLLPQFFAFAAVDWAGAAATTRARAGTRH